jgi:hypothetical protein
VQPAHKLRLARITVLTPEEHAGGERESYLQSFQRADLRREVLPSSCVTLDRMFLEKVLDSARNVVKRVEIRVGIGAFFRCLSTSVR